MVIDYLYSMGEFFQNNIEVFVTLLLALISAFVGVLVYTINDIRRLNAIYAVRGRKSSSIKPQYLLVGRPVPAYYELNEYKSLKEALKKGDHILVAGAPLSGKTRAIYEALETMNPTANVIIPRLADVDLEKFEVPLNLTLRRKSILVLDDIDKFTEKQNFKHLVDEFLKNKAVIIASCRSGMEFDKLQKTEWLSSLFKAENIITFPSDIPDEKGKQIAAKIGVSWNPSGFDGKIGSLVMDLGIMKARFTECSPEGKAVLKSIRLLYRSGVYEGKENFSRKRILLLCKKLFEINRLEKYVCDEVFSNLEKKNFIKIINDDVIWAEEVYLDSVIERDSIEVDGIAFFSKIFELFLDDDKALFSLGNRAYNIGTIDINKKYYMKISIKAFEEALKVTTLDRFPMDYAMTQNNLGTAYRTLAEVENKAENCKKSIAAYEEALKVTTLDRFPIQYAITQNNLGNAYGTLAEVENKAENCKKSIAAYEEALKVTTLDRFPMDYAMTQNNLGTAYGTLAQIENTTENCKKSITAFEEALKIRTLDSFPMDYAMTQNNLGNAYRILAQVENKAENCKKSISAFEKALKVFTKDKSPEPYNVISKNLKIAKNLCSQSN